MPRKVKIGVSLALGANARSGTIEATFWSEVILHSAGIAPEIAVMDRPDGGTVWAATAFVAGETQTDAVEAK